jgi:predicted dehydrogenase
MLDLHRCLGMPIRIAIIGLGKIARQSHVPALERSPQFRLVAGADPAGRDWALPLFPDCETLLSHYGHELDAVAICTPPQLRTPIACQCVEAGLHVLLEKPPGTSLGETQALLDLAGQRAVTVYFSWHSRMNTAVGLAHDFLQTLPPWCFEAIWRENPHDWHAGQDWIWQPGGMGVFDAGINALSILTALSDSRWLVGAAQLEYDGQQMPIAAVLHLKTLAGHSGVLNLDWRGKFPQRWAFRIATAKGDLELTGGGSTLEGALQHVGDTNGEYDRIYQKFHTLICRRQCELDYEPLRLVADAFLLASRAADTG